MSQHDVIVVAERKINNPLQPDRNAQVSLYCRSCVQRQDINKSTYMWLGTKDIYTPGEIAAILRRHAQEQGSFPEIRDTSLLDT